MLKTFGHNNPDDLHFLGTILCSLSQMVTLHKSLSLETEMTTLLSR